MSTRVRLLALILGLASMLPAQQPQGPKGGRIEGIILSSLGAPIARAAVRAESFSVTGNDPARIERTVTSTDDGRFVFENLPAGKEYVLRAERTGYLSVQYTAYGKPGFSTPIAVAEGASIKEIKMVLSPQGVLSGQVVDAYDDPVAGVMVALFEQDGSFAGNRTADDRGQFRFPGLLGTYYVRADNQGLIERQDAGAEDLSKPVSVATFYPRSLTLANAVPINVLPGTEVPNIKITLRQERVFSIRGTVVDAASEKPLPGVRITAYWTEAPTSSPINTSPQTLSKADGSFVLTRRLPGRHVLRADPPQTPETAVGFLTGTGVGRAEVTIREEDVTDVVLKATLPTMVTVTGKFVWEGRAGEPARPVSEVLGGVTSFQVLRNNTSRNPTQIFVPLQPDGSFQFRAAAGGSYSVAFQGTKSFIKRVQVNGKDIGTTAIEIPPTDGSVLTISLSSHSAQVSGVVRDKDNKPVPGALLFIRPKVLHQALARLGMSLGQADQNGRFHIENVPPGEHYTFAFAFNAQDIKALEAFTQRLIQPGEELPAERLEVKVAEDGSAEIEVKTASR